MNGAQKIEWGFCVSYAPNTTFRRFLRSVNRDCEQHREAEQNEGSPTAGLPLKKPKHFPALSAKTRAVNNYKLEFAATPSLAI
jgi:hypothetical protein